MAPIFLSKDHWSAKLSCHFIKEENKSLDKLGFVFLGQQHNSGSTDETYCYKFLFLQLFAIFHFKKKTLDLGFAGKEENTAF